METNTTVEQHEADCNKVYTTTVAIVSDRETDISMMEMELPMITSIGTTPVLAEGPADGLNGILHPNYGPEGKGPKAADLPQNKHSSRRKGDTQTHDAGTGTTNIVPHVT